MHILYSSHTGSIHVKCKWCRNRRIATMTPSSQRDNVERTNLCSWWFVWYWLARKLTRKMKRVYVVPTTLWAAGVNRQWRSRRSFRVDADFAKREHASTTDSKELWEAKHSLSMNNGCMSEEHTEWSPESPTSFEKRWVQAPQWY